MNGKRRSGSASVAVIVTALVVAGCDDRSARSARRNAPDPQTTQPFTNPDAAAQVASASQPAAHPLDAQPAKSFLTVDGKILEFPSARLRLTRTDEGVRALLFSNDPKEAISANYKGNSFYFDIPLKIAGPRDVADAEYLFKAETSEAETESPNGIFLSGMRTHLQPQDVAIKFDGESPKVTARLTGRFLVVNTTGDSAPGQFVGVTGSLFVTVEMKDE